MSGLAKYLPAPWYNGNLIPCSYVPDQLLWRLGLEMLPRTSVAMVAPLGSTVEAALASRLSRARVCNGVGLFSVPSFLEFQFELGIQAIPLDLGGILRALVVDLDAKAARA